MILDLIPLGALSSFLIRFFQYFCPWFQQKTLSTLLHILRFKHFIGKPSKRKVFRLIFFRIYFRLFFYKSWNRLRRNWLLRINLSMRYKWFLGKNWPLLFWSLFFSLWTWATGLIMAWLHVHLMIKSLLFFKGCLIMWLRKMTGLNFHGMGLLRQILFNLISVRDEVIKYGLIFLMLGFLFGSGWELVGIGYVLTGLLERKKLFFNDLVFFLGCMGVAEAAFLVEPVFVVNAWLEIRDWWEEFLVGLVVGSTCRSIGRELSWYGCFFRLDLNDRIINCQQVFD